jgi:ABC-type dipeptide/oligopeptide/nickel transport system ATPase component
MELLRTVHDRRRATVVLVTHDAELAAMADSRIVLRDGRVVENELVLRQAEDERKPEPLVLSPSPFDEAQGDREPVERSKHEIRR